MSIDTIDRSDGWVAMLADVRQLAEIISDTEFVPRGFRNRPAAIAAAILYGHEVGLPPMTALQQVQVIEGRPSITAEGQRGLALSAGHEIEYGEVTSQSVTVRGRRKGSTTWHVVTWTMEDARRAKLADKLNWRTYPRAMLKARATAELVGDLFPEVLGGLAATEESDSATVEEEAPRTRVTRGRRPKTSAGALPTPPGGAASTPAPGAPAELEPRTGSGQAPAVPVERTSLGAPGISSDGADLEPPTLWQEEHGEPITILDADDVTGQAQQVAEELLGARVIEEARPPSGKPILETHPEDPARRAQRKAMHAAFGALDVSKRKDRLEITSAVVGRDVTSSDELTPDEVSTLLDTLRLAAEADEPLAFLQEIRRTWGQDPELSLFPDDDPDPFNDAANE